ncbi:MAG: tRNA (cytidine(34)-2'-O)-methyltransferase [Verrucomicrobiales bacterium]|nr:tRNA (cytidine(34)-2'-O)-methyltransferase [Verrucomicrobiales bacterium]
MLNVVLFEPEIPPNTGTIGRLCHATGARLHLIEPLGFSTDDRALKRAGLDYWKELNPLFWSSLEECLSSAEPDTSTYFLTTKTDRPYWAAEFQKNDYLVFGPETRGLPESLLHSNSDRTLTIPQTRGRSLNLAVSTGVVLLDAIRQINCR